MKNSSVSDITIAIFSHNHFNTIEKAIEGILHQKTKYSYTIYLVDDGSSDGTQDIIHKYSQQYPDIIRPLIFKENEGVFKRAVQIYISSKSKYLSWLDADDYWIYEYKLQNQIDFLNKNPDFAGCFHDAKIISEFSYENPSINQIIYFYKYYSQFNHYTPIFYPYQLLERNIIPTASLVFRNVDLNEFFEKYKKYNLTQHSLSWALHLYIIKNSKFYYFNEPWSVYYDHKKGYSKTENKKLFVLNNIKIYKILSSDNYYKHYKNKIYQMIARHYEELSYSETPINIEYGFYTQLYYLFFIKSNIWYYIQRALKKLI
ncbi:MAG: glycosyltransferase [Bacteroidales bacterium]|nr:glycosyltransferase [Bacteroidales bacterium]